jgi:hypothetical protein
MTLAAGKGRIEWAKNQPLREAIARDNENRGTPRRGRRSKRDRKSKAQVRLESGGFAPPNSGSTHGGGEAILPGAEGEHGVPVFHPQELNSRRPLERLPAFSDPGFI